MKRSVLLVLSLGLVLFSPWEDRPPRGLGEPEAIEATALSKASSGEGAGLWGVRFEDLQKVYDAGFRAVRPPWFQPYNFSSTHEYAVRADSIGYQKMIYDLGLTWWYGEYRRYVRSNRRLSPRGAPSDTSLAEIRNLIAARIASLSLVGNLQGFPYIDEPDDIGRLEKKSDDGILLWPAGVPPGDLHRGCMTNPATGIGVVREFASLVRFADSTARAHSRHLIIATMNLEAVYPSQDSFSVLRTTYPGYFYNSEATELMNSLYAAHNDQVWVLARVRGLYPGKQISQIMNFFDVTWGCRESCSQSSLVDQMNLNSQYSSWHWFYQGEYISPTHRATVRGLNSVDQWDTLLRALSVPSAIID